MVREVLICRGCKTNLRLDDHLNEARASLRRLDEGVEQLLGSFRNLSIRFRL